MTSADIWVTFFNRIIESLSIATPLSNLHPGDSHCLLMGWFSWPLFLSTLSIHSIICLGFVDSKFEVLLLVSCVPLSWVPWFLLP